MIKLTKILRQALLKEDASLSVNGQKMRMHLKPNINPTKQGVRIQFSAEGEIGSSEKENMTTTLQRVLNKALSPYGMSVNEDPDVPHQAATVIGFYLTVEQLEAFITDAVQKVLKTISPNSKSDDNEKQKGDEDSEES